jgi:hypothetical protein
LGLNAPDKNRVATTVPATKTIRPTTPRMIKTIGFFGFASTSAADLLLQD